MATFLMSIPSCSSEHLRKKSDDAFAIGTSDSLTVPPFDKDEILVMKKATVIILLNHAQNKELIMQPKGLGLFNFVKFIWKFLISEYIPITL